ncbi:MAG: hypothetical protein P8Y63_15675 [Deltaproteobacteria bacterium]
MVAKEADDDLRFLPGDGSVDLGDPGKDIDEKINEFVVSLGL